MSGSAVQPRWRHRLATLARIAFVAVAGFFVLPEPFGGNTTYVVVKGTSMRPHYVTGDIVAARPADRYEVGDVVVYAIPEGEVGEGKLVMHRIIGTDTDGRFVFRGDNRDEVDTFRLGADDIVGVERLHVPHVALVSQVVLRWWVLGGIMGVISLLVLWPKPPEETSDGDTTDRPADDGAVDHGADVSLASAFTTGAADPNVPLVNVPLVSVVVDGDALVLALAGLSDFAGLPDLVGPELVGARQACVDEADRLVRRYGGTALVVFREQMAPLGARRGATVHHGDLATVVDGLVSRGTDFVGLRTLMVVTDDAEQTAAARRQGAAVVPVGAWLGLVTT